MTFHLTMQVLLSLKNSVHAILFWKISSIRYPPPFLTSLQSSSTIFHHPTSNLIQDCCDFFLYSLLQFLHGSSLRDENFTFAIPPIKLGPWNVTAMRRTCCGSISHVLHFHLPGYVNNQNYRYRAPKNPQQLHQRPLHSDELTIRCGITSFWVLGPYFFEDNEGAAATVMTEGHVEMSRIVCEPELRRRAIDPPSVRLQQDGATGHTSRGSMSVLREMFPQHVISRGGDVPRPALSPDLSGCDYF
jgi:hypothetical protein